MFEQDGFESSDCWPLPCITLPAALVQPHLAVTFVGLQVGLRQHLAVPLRTM